MTVNFGGIAGSINIHFGNRESLLVDRGGRQPKQSYSRRWHSLHIVCGSAAAWLLFWLTEQHIITRFISPPKLLSCCLYVPVSLCVCVYICVWWCVTLNSERAKAWRHDITNDVTRCLATVDVIASGASACNMIGWNAARRLKHIQMMARKTVKWICVLWLGFASAISVSAHTAFNARLQFFEYSDEHTDTNCLVASSSLIDYWL